MLWLNFQYKNLMGKIKLYSVSQVMKIPDLEELINCYSWDKSGLKKFLMKVLILKAITNPLQNLIIQN